MRRTLPLVLWILVGIGGASAVAADASGYQADARVSAPTRLDAIFPLANQSPVKPPDGWLAGYESTAQTFELYVPPGVVRKDGAAQDGAPDGGSAKEGSSKEGAKTDRSKKSSVRKGGQKKNAQDAGEAAGRALVLFVSPSAKAIGWSHWKETCEKHGVLFAGPHGAGNDSPMPRRVRIVLDVLDEMRRRYDVDPDRTYVAGFSGGGRIACALAFSLPELFGGVVPICAAGDLREESWLRQRVVDRISVAHITGETDFNRGEVERYRGPLLADVGVRSRVRMFPKLGHSVPTGRPLTETFDWLEDDLPRRRSFARTHPASRVARDAAPTRAEQATALFDEGKKRLTDPKTLYSGLMQLSGVRVRWADLPEAAKATEILAEHDARAERPWEADDIAEQRRFLIAQARGIDRYASGPLPDVYAKQRPMMLRRALELWSQVIQDGQDEKAVEEAKKRTVELTDLLQKSETK